MEIWSNPRCSKSRAAVDALEKAGIRYTERRYLEAPPTVDELSAVLERLGLEPWELVRFKEAASETAGLRTLPRDDANRSRWLQAMVEHPIVIERPIVLLDDGRALVARSDEALAVVTDASRG